MPMSIQYYIINTNSNLLLFFSSARSNVIMLSFGLSEMTCNSTDIINEEGNLTPPLHGIYLCVY